MGERTRKSLDCPYYRSSLESISEYKTREAFFSVHPGRERVGSFESPLTNFNAHRFNTPELYTHDFFEKPNSVSSRSSASTASAQNPSIILDHDNVYGEWNNFWLNYNNVRNRHQPSPFLCENSVITDDFSDVCASTPQKEAPLENPADDDLCLSKSEVLETIHCCKRVIEILEDALKRNDFVPVEEDGSNPIRKCSIYLQQQEESRRNSIDPLLYFLNDAQKQPKQIVKPNIQQPGCMNNFLGSGVADIFKKVIQKRKQSDVGVP